MEEQSEEQIISRLLELENEGQASQRAELTGERFVSLLQDPESGSGYVLLHGLDVTEGAEVRDRYSSSDEDPLTGESDPTDGQEQTDTLS